MEGARNGFQKAISDQAESDALMTQLLLAALTIGFAAGFEPLLSSALLAGKIGGTTEQIAAETKRVAAIVEKYENPAVATVSSVPNVVGAKPKPAAKTDSPVTYLTVQWEALMGQAEKIEGAFSDRADAISALPDEAAATINTGPQEATYQTLFTKLNGAALDKESLREQSEIAAIVERYLWAAWFLENYPTWAGPGAKGYHSFKGFGTIMEDRLNGLGIAERAGVELTGHWYSSNSAGWAEKLVDWAKRYSDHGERFREPGK
jgi:hypothetical protein